MNQVYLVVNEQGSILATINAPYGFPYPYNQAMTKAIEFLPNAGNGRLYILEAKAITEVTGNKGVQGFHPIEYDNMGLRVS